MRSTSQGCVISRCTKPKESAYGAARIRLPETYEPAVQKNDQFSEETGRLKLTDILGLFARERKRHNASPPHSANRHEAGCRGAGADCVRFPAMNCPRGRLFRARSGMLRIQPQIQQRGEL
jgi:hypothetical protein